ncbi:MAG: DGQHR domain-containing protein [Thermaerobacter sp.]|nr:DGQHR domain-containing protein [Thermaerobacter sp.]
MTDGLNAFETIDPTRKALLQQRIEGCSIGKTPSKFFKVRADLTPGDLIKLVGYDPRTVNPKAKTPANISHALEDLITEVQRNIDPRRVEEMVAYLHQAVENDGYADWSEIDLVTAAQPDTSTYETDHGVGFPQATEYFITDGQHRYCAILDFVRQYPPYANRFTVAVAIGVLPEGRLSAWAGQAFHDKNYLQKAVNATKALAVDTRDLHNRLTKELTDHPVIKAAGGINLYKQSVSAGAPEFATHAVLYKFVRGFAEGHRGVYKGALNNPSLTDETYEAIRASLWEYLGYLGQAFPSWRLVPDREEYLFRASASLQALGVLGHLIYSSVDEPDQRKRLTINVGERNVDWRRANWQTWGIMGRVNEETHEVSPTSTRQVIEATIQLVRNRSGIEKYLESGRASDSNA